MNDDTASTPPAWALALVSRKAWVLHQPTHTLGRARAYHKQDNVEVLEIEPGHTFIADEANFAVLTDSQAKFVEAAGKAVTHFTGECVTLAAACAMEPSTAMRMLASLLKAQAGMLVAAAMRAPAPTRPDTPEATGHDNPPPQNPQSEGP